MSTYEFMCAHCYSVVSAPRDVLDAGTTECCTHCGEETVIDLLRPADYVENRRLAFYVFERADPLLPSLRRKFR